MWDPTTTGGVASPGILGLPFVPVLLWVALVGTIATVTYLRRGGAIKGPTAWGSRLRSYFRLSRKWTSKTEAVVFALVIWLPFVAVRLLDSWDPLAAADPFAPGPNVAEVLRDGQWEDDSITNAMSWDWSAGEPCLSECSGPRYLYRVRPGERYWWLATVHNDGPLPVTLIGRQEPDILPAHFGLALLRDPSELTADAWNLRPFEPVSLAPGAAVTLAMVIEADSCADPAGNTTWGGYAAGYPFVYEVLGWRRVGDIWPHFSVTEAGCE